MPIILRLLVNSDELGFICLSFARYWVDRTRLFYPETKRKETCIMLANNEIELSSFGEYLLKKHTAREGSVRYYVQWVRNFLELPQNPGQERTA